MSDPRVQEKKKTIRKNILNLAFLVLTVFVLLISLLVTIVFPHSLNEYENRYAEKVIVPSPAAVLDGSFQESMENALSDQIPFAERMKETYNTIFSRYTASLLPAIFTARVDDPAKEGPGADEPPISDPSGGEDNPIGGEDDPEAGSNVPLNPPKTDPEKHLPQPDVPGTARIYTAKKTDGGRIILTNMDPAEEVPIYAALSKEVSFFRSSLVYSQYNLSYLKSGCEKHATHLNELMAAHPNQTFYAYYIERETDLDLTTNEKSGVSDYVFEQLALPKEQKRIFRVDSYEDFDEYYYKGDHHWNYKGSYEGYRQILAMMRPEEAPLLPKEVKSAGLMNGSKTMGSAAIYCEEMSGYVFDFPTFEVTINGATYPDYGYIANYFRQTEREPEAQKYTNYANCYGGDNGITVIRNASSENGNVLLIGESYDNAVLKLLASHFTELHAVDLRNHEAQIGEPFRYSQYCEAHNITDVLFIGCLDYWTSTVFNPKD